MDSTIIIQVGVAQLQKLINTMKYYKEKYEEAITLAQNLEDALQHAEKRIHLLETQTFMIKKIGEIEI